MLFAVRSIIGLAGMFSFALSISLFTKRNERKRLVVFGIGGLMLIVVGFL
jgi:hypothetical protein